jgi:RNA polymerase sigma factor (sigma-70 family)
VVKVVDEEPSGSGLPHPAVVGIADDSLIETLVRPLTAALVAAYGPDRGREAAAEALLWACEHRDRVAQLETPVAYLFRVGQSRTRSRAPRHLKFAPGEDLTSPPADHEFEPGLNAALATLSPQQRIAVLLVHGAHWTYRDVSDVLQCRPATTQRHVERGMKKLRKALGVEL